MTAAYHDTGPDGAPQLRLLARGSREQVECGIRRAALHGYHGTYLRTRELGPGSRVVVDHDNGTREVRTITAEQHERIVADERAADERAREAALARVRRELATGEIEW